MAAKKKRKPAYKPPLIMLKQELGHWEYKGKDYDTSTMFGFVYLLVDKATGKGYLGKRQLWSYKKNSMTKTGTSVWRTYHSSSEHVKEARAEGAQFEYHMLGVFKTRAWTSYTEAYLQFVLTTMTERDSNGERLWFNNQIAAIKFIPGLDEEQHSTMEGCLKRAKAILKKRKIV